MNCYEAEDKKDFNLSFILWNSEIFQNILFTPKQVDIDVQARQKFLEENKDLTKLPDIELKINSSIIEIDHKRNQSHMVYTLLCANFL